MNFLVITLLASSAFALKSPTLCPGGKGNDFVCSVIEPVNKEESYSEFPSIDGILIGKNGQANFFKTAEAVEILRSSLKNQTTSEALKTESKDWFKILDVATEQLETSKNGTQKLITSAISGLQNLEASILNTTTTKTKKVEEKETSAINQLKKEVDQKAIRFLSTDFKNTAAHCFDGLSKQIETLQNATQKIEEKSYGSLIDLTDQIGLCIQKADTGVKCIRDVRAKLAAIRSLPKISEVNAAKFEAIARRNIEKDACLTKAEKLFNTSVDKILKSATKK